MNECIFSKLWPADLDVRRQLAAVDEPTLEQWRGCVSRLLMQGVERTMAERHALVEITDAILPGNSTN